MKTIEPHRRFSYDGAMIDSKKTIRTDVPFGQKVFDSKTKRWISPEQVEPPSRLAELEAIIERHDKPSFIAIAEALLEIRDNELYKERYGTFEEYYQLRWGFKKSYAYSLMDAGKEALKLPEPERPKTERAMRKVLKNSRKPSAVADKTESKKAKGIIMDRITPEDQAAELFEDIDTRIRANKKNLKFLQALDEWLTESGL